MLKGRCECGKVSFNVDENPKSVVVCHCSQCRRTSGHIWASIDVSRDAVTFTIDEGLSWYDSSDIATRGFCKFCGSSLFYKKHELGNIISISSGSINEPTGMHIKKHIFVKDKGDYYTIDDDAPQVD